MKRLMNTVRFDFQIQLRYGFLVASVFSIIVWVMLLVSLPLETRTQVAPAIIYLDLALVGFFFISGLVLYEKGEATIYAVLITPLRFAEYLAAKLITLTLLAISISLALILFTTGLHVAIGLVILGTTIMSLISLLIGFIAVAPFSSFSSYLIPSQLPALILYIPIIPFLGLLDGPVFYLFPTHGAMLMLRGAFAGIEGWQVLYAVLYGGAWSIGLVFLARYMFNRYVVTR